jgi:uncharacterized protein
MFLIAVKPGQEVIETVTAELAHRHVKNGAIVSLVGAIDSCCISNMTKDDPRSDVLTKYEQPFEMAGTGEIKDGTPHIHCILGQEGDCQPGWTSPLGPRRNVVCQRLHHRIRLANSRSMPGL